ncbi:MAG: Gfo/Idh/MocA family oxidoreductase [Sphingobacteriales bacterium]|nr:Gfo/Idh/MocA family oxidoreductase [Sphingobacteriales bacterium]OJW37058.1 MAG: hyaluronate lyase [Sphingobacteriales bacterium 46-32]
MDRRHFLEMTGLLSGVLMLSPATLLAHREDAIRIGIIGCGDRGQGIMQMMASLKEQYAITAICDILDFRLEAAAKLAPAKTYKDYRQLLDAKDVDAVVVATSLHMHYAIAADAIRAGKSVYLEKTMTYNIPEAQELVKLCARYTGQILAVGHQYRYTPLYFKVKEMISKGYLGDVTQIDCRWDRNWNWRRPVPTGYADEQINWRMYKRYSGGLPAELLSHQMDFINWAFDTHPDEVMGTGGIDHFNDGRETYDNVQVLLRYKEKGMIGNFGATCGNAHEGYIFKIKGTKGMVSLLPDKGVFYPEEAAKKELQTVDGVSGATRLEWNTDGGISIVNEKMQDGTWYALKEFYNTVKTGTQPVSNVKTGATTAVCVHLANEAIFSHKILSWKPAYNF